MKKNILGLVLILMLLLGCDDSDVVNRNLNKDSKNFKVTRRIVLFNGVTDKYLFTVEGRCTVDGELWEGNVGKVLTVICKVADGNDDSAYKKHYLGLSDNVSFFVEQLDAKNVSKYHYKVTFKPSAILPDVEIR